MFDPNFTLDNSNYKYIQGLNNQTLQLQTTHHKYNHKNQLYSKDLISPWSLDQRKKIDILKNQKTDQFKREVKTQRIQQRKYIVDNQNITKKKIQKLEIPIQVSNIQHKQQRKLQSTKGIAIFNANFSQFADSFQRKNNNINSVRRIRNPVTKVQKKHLIQKIDYKQIQNAFYKKPSFSNRFTLFCKKINEKMIEDNHSSIRYNLPESIKIVNFPFSINSIEKRQNQLRGNRTGFNKTYMLKNRTKNQSVWIDQRLDEQKKKKIVFEQAINQLKKKEKQKKIYLLDIKI